MLVALLTPHSAYACSMSGDWVKPTNYEMIEMADAIVIAKAIKQTSLFGMRDDNQVTFKIMETLKGTPPEIITTEWARLGVMVTPSDPNQISSAHPESFTGGCSRTTFKRNRTYILFLGQDEDDKFNIGITSFSRDAEDYSKLWHKTIAFYLDIQTRYDRDRQLDVLRERYQEYVEQSPGSDEYKISMDIAEHFSSTSPYKPSSFLIAAYEALEIGPGPAFGGRHPDANHENNEAQKLSDFVFGVTGEEFDLKAQKLSILWALTEDGHEEPETKAYMMRFLEDSHSPEYMGIVLAYLSRNGHYDEALTIARRDIPNVLEKIDPDNLKIFTKGLYHMSKNPDDWEKPKWLVHETARDWWPKFEYDIQARLKENFNQDYGLSRAVLEALRPVDYRANPDLTRMIANHYKEKEVMAWAEKEIYTLAEKGISPDSTLYQLPIEVLIMRYYPPKPEVVDGLFCNAKTRPALLRHWAHNTRYSQSGWGHMNFDDNPEYLAEKFNALTIIMSEKELADHKNQLQILSNIAGESIHYKKVPNIDNLFDAHIAYLDGKLTDIPEMPSRYFQYEAIICE